MKSLKNVIKSLGLNSNIKITQLAKYLKLIRPISLHHLLNRGIYLASFDMDQQIRNKWSEFNWEDGPLGKPITTTIFTYRNFMRTTQFENGGIYYTYSTPGETKPCVVLDPIRTRYNELLSGTNPYFNAQSIPRTDTTLLPTGILFNKFQEYYPDPTNTQLIPSESFHIIMDIQNRALLWLGVNHIKWMNDWIYITYDRLGGINGFLGPPLTDQYLGSIYRPDKYLDDAYCVDFLNGKIAWDINNEEKPFKIYDKSGTLIKILNFKGQYCQLPVQQSGPGEPLPSGSGSPSPDPQTPPLTHCNKIILCNCHSQHRSVYVKLFDMTTISGWKDLGEFKHQYDDWGVCPGENSSPLEIPLEDKHMYHIIALDREAIGCNQMSEFNTACYKWEGFCIGDKNAAPCIQDVQGGYW